MRKSIDINYNCNNDCIFCFNNHDKAKSFDFAKAKEDLALAAKAKIQYVDFYGGEPLLYKDKLLELIKYAHELGLISSVATNITLLDKNTIDTFNKYGLKQIRTSLLGNNEDTHDLITRRKGSFAETINNLKDLKKYYQGEVIVNVVVTKINYKKLKQIVDLIEGIDQDKKFIIKLSNLVYNGDENLYKKLALKYHLFQPILKEMINYLQENNREFYIEKFPICMAREFAQRFVKEEDLHKETIIWHNYCDKCEFKNNGCVGLNVNYNKYIETSPKEILILNKNV